MRELFDSVRRSFAFPPPASGDESPTGTLVGKINSRIRRSRAFTRSSRQLPPPSSSSASPTPPSPPTTQTHAAADTDTSGVDVPPPFRWRKGDLIGCGAFGRVYMGMNLDSGELLAVKEVLIAANHASREKAQAHIMELEKEVNLLKNLSHPNIVRYLGTVREENSLNILLEFVPGGSISSLLYKFGSFPDAVIKTYTKQLLLGLEYLHKSEIMHRDIKGANILVDNSGHIKLADFGASKKVVELATISGAKSMKGTPYWMAPEVILQTGHSFSADIWSVGCTVIEMATGKPPWSEQYHQEVSALFHIGTTKSHPPIPEHLSVVAKDFLLKCLHKEPNLRPTASELLQHPFVTGEQSRPMTSQAPLGEKDENLLKSGVNLESISYSPGKTEMTSGEREFVGMTRCPDDDDMCLMDDMHDFEGKYFPKSVCADDVNQSYNPMCEPSEDWGCHSVQSHGLPNVVLEEGSSSEILADEHLNSSPASSTLKNNNIIVSPLSCTSISEDDEELTELKIKVFLEEKAMELKKLQTPLYEEFYNTINGSCSPLPNLIERFHDENGSNFLKLPPKSKSPSRVSPSKSGGGDTVSPNKFVPNIISQQTSSPPPDPTPNQCKESRRFQRDATSPRMSFLEIQRKWKEELDQELQRQRERMRQAGVVGKTSSPNDKGALHRPKERCQIASPGR